MSIIYKLAMWRYIVTCSVLSLYAVHCQDCRIRFTFRNGDNPIVFNNKTELCQNWMVGYSASGASAVSIEFDSAPDAGGVAGTFVSFSGALTKGSNPMTATDVAVSTYNNGTNCCSWVRVNPVTITNATNQTAVVTGSVFGWRLSQPNFASVTPSLATMVAPFTLPNDANFIWQASSQDTATETVNADGSISIVYHGVGSSTPDTRMHMRCDTTTTLTPPYTFIAAFMPSWSLNDHVNLMSGIAITDGSKYVAEQYLNGSGQLESNAFVDCSTIQFTSCAGGGEHLGQGGFLFWTRIVNDGTRRKWTNGNDGKTWEGRVFDEPVNTFITETHPCVYVVANNGNYSNALKLVSWKTCANSTGVC